MLRTLVVVGLSALFIGLTLPNAWLPVGSDFGTNVDSRFKVVSVIPGSLPASAGLRAGDQIDPASTDLAGRALLKNAFLLREGQSVRYSVVHGGVKRQVVVTQPAIKPGDYLLGIIKRTSATLFIITAATLVLLRPSVMLWGFFLFALGSTHGTPLILKWVNDTVGSVGGAIADPLWDLLGTLGLLLFGTHFPAPATRGIRAAIDRSIPILVALVVIAEVPYTLFMLGVSVPPEWAVVAAYVPAIAYTLGIIALLSGFFEAQGAARQRLRWVVAGFAVYWGAVLYLKLAPLFPNEAWPTAWSDAGLSYDALNGLVLFIPLAVAYAVLKHHVLDINFVIGRGLVYAILTSFAVATFAIIEWLLGGVLAQTRLAAAGEVVAAVAIGFGLNGMHARVDRFVDAVIFRKRHLAEQRMARVAAGLPHAESYASIAELVVREPLEALGLRSGAFFRRLDDGVFHCESAIGIAVDQNVIIRTDEALVTHLHGERGYVTLAHVGWAFPIATDPAAAPVFAFPLFVRHDLRAIAFYGGHDTGEAIDPDELRALNGLCAGASSALDHVAAVELAQRLEELRQANEALRSDVQRLERSMQATTA